MFYLSNILNWNQPFQYKYIYVYIAIIYGSKIWYPTKSIWSHKGCKETLPIWLQQKPMIRLPAATCRHSMVSPSLFAPLLVLGPQLLSAHVVRNGKHGGFFHPTGSHGKLGSMEFHGVPWGSMGFHGVPDQIVSLSVVLYGNFTTFRYSGEKSWIC